MIIRKQLFVNFVCIVIINVLLELVVNSEVLSALQYEPEPIVIFNEQDVKKFHSPDPSKRRATSLKNKNTTGLITSKRNISNFSVPKHIKERTSSHADICTDSKCFPSLEHYETYNVTPSVAPVNRDTQETFWIPERDLDYFSASNSSATRTLLNISESNSSPSLNKSDDVNKHSDTNEDNDIPIKIFMTQLMEKEPKKEKHLKIQQNKGKQPVSKSLASKANKLKQQNPVTTPVVNVTEQEPLKTTTTTRRKQHPKTTIVNVHDEEILNLDVDNEEHTTGIPISAAVPSSINNSTQERSTPSHLNSFEEHKNESSNLTDTTEQPLLIFNANELSQERSASPHLNHYEEHKNESSNLTDTTEQPLLISNTNELSQERSASPHLNERDYDKPDIINDSSQQSSMSPHLNDSAQEKTMTPIVNIPEEGETEIPNLNDSTQQKSVATTVNNSAQQRPVEATVTELVEHIPSRKSSNKHGKEKLNLSESIENTTLSTNISGYDELTTNDNDSNQEGSMEALASEGDEGKTESVNISISNITGQGFASPTVNVTTQQNSIVDDTTQKNLVLSTVNNTTPQRSVPAYINDTVLPIINDTMSPIINDTISPSINDTVSPSSIKDTVSSPSINDTVPPSINDTESPSINDTESSSINDTVSSSINE